MEGNKDESERCLAIAEQCIGAGDTEKAIRFLKKANRLYPSKKASGKMSDILYF